LWLASANRAVELPKMPATASATTMARFQRDADQVALVAEVARAVVMVVAVTVGMAVGMAVVIMAATVIGGRGHDRRGDGRARDPHGHAHDHRGLDDHGRRDRARRAGDRREAS